MHRRRKTSQGKGKITDEFMAIKQERRRAKTLGKSKTLRLKKEDHENDTPEVSYRKAEKLKEQLYGLHLNDECYEEWDDICYLIQRGKTKQFLEEI